MSGKELAAKEAYFKEQSLLDISDDEISYNDEAFDRIESAMAEMPPTRLARQPSSFLGPTPKEVRADFEAHTTRRRTTIRDDAKTLNRSATVPEIELTQSFPVTKPRTKQLSTIEDNANSKMKRITSLPNMTGLDQTPFYQQMGVVPRELKNGKNVKLADNIKLEPESKQLLRGKIVYFYPNDDISMVRRTRIHKVIQLGAAWVNKWRDDVTHVFVDDVSYTYTQLLRHFNRAGFPKKVVLAKFDPFIPQCIQFGTLMDPSAARFSIKGAPQRGQASQMPKKSLAASETSGESQASLKIKSPKKQKGAVPSQKTDSIPTEGTPSQAIEKIPESPFQERVEDSFVMPSSEIGEQLPEATIPGASFGDELLQAIRETKAIAHLPIDDEDDESTPTPSVIGADDIDSGTDDELLEMPTKSRKKQYAISAISATGRSKKKGFDQSSFQCMDPSTNGFSCQNPNTRTIQILEEMGRHYDQMQDQWRTLAYRRGVNTLKKQTVRINTAKEAAALPSIGSRLAEKIEEIVLTNRLRKLDNTKDDPLDQVLRLFLGVYGAGLVQANKWIQAGHRTLEDLYNKAKLTESQKIGLEHYTDFNSRMPRAEVAAHGAIVISALKKIDPTFQATIMGSYRRGASDSGDIDMLITRPGSSLSHLHTVVFSTLVPHLFRTAFLTASLATSRAADATGSKWHGASCLPGSCVWRRMDFLLVPECEMGAALLYFTGNDIFNRSMRLLARKKGMRLNQKGLYKDVKRGRRGEKLNEGVLVEGRSERRIFEVLGVPWREPHERVC
ncbi:DNA-directed DNA polymerase [Ascochyta rabiei]|uniref:DNA-directed DNA polymerase n=1 Tax=Didymella rabiei TaxID=5454 RepID=A0A163BIC9_DIDRA|nr:DNA-directed DNA polymerase [Ascochyta rabiei]KZM21787.1 DNA binding [Ascochyta rabiei]UPX11086.1 DNA-directed DNA polymerase [Ascochyta rabiei]